MNAKSPVTSHSYSNDSNKAEFANFVLRFDFTLQNGMNEDGMNEWNLCAIDTSRNKPLSSPQIPSFCRAELLYNEGWKCDKEN